MKFFLTSTLRWRRGEGALNIAGKNRYLRRDVLWMTPKSTCETSDFSAMFEIRRVFGGVFQTVTECFALKGATKFYSTHYHLCVHYFLQYEFIQVFSFYRFFWETSFSPFCAFCTVPNSMQPSNTF